MRKMASAKFLEEALSTDVDESAVSAIVGSLETQLTTTPSKTVPYSVLLNIKREKNGPECAIVTTGSGLKNTFVESSVGVLSGGGSATAGGVLPLSSPNGLQNHQNSPVVIGKLQTHLQRQSVVSTPTSISSTGVNAIATSTVKKRKSKAKPATGGLPAIGSTSVNNTTTTVVTAALSPMLHQTLTANSTAGTNTTASLASANLSGNINTKKNFGPGQVIRQSSGNSISNMPSTAAATNSSSPHLNNNNNSPNSGVISPALLQAGGLPASGYLSSPAGTVSNSGVLSNNNIVKPPVVQPSIVTSVTTLANGSIPNNYLQFTTGSLVNGSSSPSIIASPQRQQTRVITQAPIANPVSLLSTLSPAGTHHNIHHPPTHLVSSTNTSNVLTSNLNSGFSSLVNSNHGSPINSGITNSVTTTATKLPTSNLITGVGATNSVTAMTVNVNSGAASGSGVGTGVGVTQSQTVVLTKPPVGGMTMSMAPTHNTAAVTSGSSIPGQQPAILNAPGGIQIFNMNAMRAVGNSQIPGGTKALAPRMILNSQVLAGGRPGPGQPITLQALPGLPPGTQGLLVKTENGQYQLLRVGMPPPTSTAATGTHVVPTTAATSTSMSIAPQLSTPSLSSSTSSSTHLNSIPSNFATLSSSSHSMSSSPLVSSSIITTSSNPSHSFINTMSSPNSGGTSSSLNSHISLQQQSIVNQVAATTVVVSTSGVTPSIITNASMNNTRPIASSNVSTHSSIPNNPPMTASANTTTYRLQNVPSVPPTTTTSNVQSGVGMTASMSMQPQLAHPQVPQASAPSSAPTNANAATANSVSQMSAETAKIKCKNFLSFLLELSAKQNQQVARNVKSLIQGLVDGKVNAEDFSDRLQKEVNSQPQPCLVGFLKKSLPHLRHSLATNELKIDGIKPPPLSSVVPAAPPVTALIPQNQVRPPPAPVPTTPVRIITPINSIHPSPVTTSSSMASNLAPIPRSTAAAVQQRFASVRPAKSSASSKSKSNSASTVSASSSPATSSTPAAKSREPPTLKSTTKEKDKKALFASSGGDDDINDVAAMGGVNLAEETQKIMGSTEFVGTQIRSCKDEIFLQIPLQSKIKAIAAKHGLDEPPPEITAMISHATEERLKYLLEKLSVIAEHRLDVIKMDDRYEVTQDVKGQLRFLEELDKLERKRHDEQEREMMMRAAKSRSKSEDPEQAKLKAKAKEMQRVAMEEMRQREANLTALQAIGPRKKPKLDAPSGSQSTTSQNSLGGLGASNSLNRPQMGLRPRLKRVNLRDLLFLLEQEKETMRSSFLYKQLLLK